MPDQFDSTAALLDRLMATPVGDRARVMNECANPAADLAALVDHSTRMALADAAKADQATDVVVNLVDRMGSQLDRARARRARARALSYAGRFRDALFVCEEGVRLADEAGNAIEAARTRLASMHALGELGRLEEAIAAGEAARQAFLSVGESALAARADLNIGTAHQRRDDPQTAVRCFERARPLLLNEPAMLGPLDNNRGEALLALHDFAGAERAYSQALESLRSTNAHAGAAIAESNLAEVATRQGRLQKAMLHFERARQAFESGASPTHLARLLAEQADAMAVLGMPRDAVRQYEQALHELDSLGLALEAARARAGLGTVLLRLGRHSQAETNLAAAATALSELGHATARARVDLLRAELAAAGGRTTDARAMGLRALATLHDRPADSAAARLLLGRLSAQAGRDSEAEADFAHADALARQLDIAPLIADVLHARARLRRGQGRHADAITDLQAAVAQVERIRGTLQADRFRASFLGDRAAIYEDLAGAALDRGQEGDIARAFAAIEHAKSRVLFDRMQSHLASEISTESSNDTTRELLDRLRQARADLNGLYSVVGDERRGAHTNEAAWREKLRQREREADDIESRLATTAGIGTFFSQPASLADVQASLPVDAMMVEYFAEGDELGAIAVSRQSASVHRGLGSVRDLVERLRQLQFQINRALRPGAMDGERGQRLTADAQRLLDDLGARLLAPVRLALDSMKRLVIVPHAELHAVPFHALTLDGEPALQQWSVSTAPSATVLVRLAREESHAIAAGGSLVVGVRDDHASHMVEEARSVAVTLAGSENSCMLLIDDEATAERVQNALHGTTLVHFSCHGRYAAESPMASGLLMHDRWLTVRDLLEARLEASLVTLSGCETGLSSVESGDELTGLVCGLLSAGAKTVVASLWRVDDATTREFMAGFYGSLRTVDGDLDAGRALREAQLRMRQSHPHPAFWASFVQAGRP